MKSIKNIIIGVLTILLIISLTYICYDKFLNKNNISDNNEDEVDNNIENDYDIYKNNFINIRDEYYAEVKNKAYFSRDSHTSIGLDNKGTLYYLSDNNKDIIATNVLDYEFLYSGNGGQKYLYFIREDGTVSSTDIYIIPSNDNELHFDKNNMNIQDNIGGYINIIGFIEGIVSTCGDEICDDAASPMFVDINGNMYNININ